MHTDWLELILEITCGGPSASWPSRMVRICLSVCSIVAAIQLTIMWSTRWGDRHLPAKSFLLSLLLHLCIGLSWFAVIESRQELGAVSPIQEPIKIQLAAADAGGEYSDSQGDSIGGATSFLTPTSTGPRTRQNGSQRSPQGRSMTEQTAFEPSPADRPRQVLPAVMDLPRMDSTTDAPAAPPEQTMAPDRLLASLPASTSAIESEEPQSRVDSNGTSRTRQMRTRTSPQDSLPPAARANSVATPAAIPTLPSVPLMNDVRPTVPAVVADSSARVVAARAPDRAVRTDRGVVSGVVTDAVTGRPLARSVVRFDRGDGKALVAVTRNDGSYEIVLPETPETFVITASQADYLPDARNLRSKDVTGKTHRVDFSLRTSLERAIAVENDPAVHHLGNDQFEGAANSKFQKRSEGDVFAAKFTVTAEQMRTVEKESAVTFLAKGVQCPVRLQINGRLLATEKGLSPVDGGYGQLVFPFDSAFLREGQNDIRLTALSCQGDLDDFEFVNIQIRFSKPK